MPLVLHCPLLADPCLIQCAELFVDREGLILLSPCAANVGPNTFGHDQIQGVVVLLGILRHGSIIAQSTIIVAMIDLDRGNLRIKDVIVVIVQILVDQLERHICKLFAALHVAGHIQHIGKPGIIGTHVNVFGAVIDLPFDLVQDLLCPFIVFQAKAAVADVQAEDDRPERIILHCMPVVLIAVRRNAIALLIDTHMIIRITDVIQQGVFLDQVAIPAVEDPEAIVVCRNSAKIISQAGIRDAQKIITACKKGAFVCFLKNAHRFVSIGKHRSASSLAENAVCQQHTDFSDCIEV